MRNRALWLTLAILVCLPALAGDTEVKAGGVQLTLPAPAADFADSGDRLRTTVFEVLTPSYNRLLAAWLPTGTLAEIQAGKPPGHFDSYGMVEILRQAEYVDCTPDAFQLVLKGSEDQFGGSLEGKLALTEEEMNIRMRSLGAKPVEIGHPTLLGPLFRKTDAAGFAMLVALKQGDNTVTLATGFALLRVKQRLLFAYLYRRNDSPDAVNWVQKNLEAWGDAILARNK